MNKIRVGDAAPLWDLDDQDEEKIVLEDYVGKKNILLAFHPLAWTSICALQMKDLETHREEFARNDTVAFGLSVDSVPCKNAWARSLGITQTRLPSDFWPHGGVAKLYGVLNEELGVSERSVFLIDRAGKIAFTKVYPVKQVPDIEEIINAVRQAASIPVGPKIR